MVTLSDTSLPLKGISQSSINDQRIRDRRNAFHDPLNELERKIKICKHVFFKNSYSTESYAFRKSTLITHLIDSPFLEYSKVHG